MYIPVLYLFSSRVGGGGGGGGYIFIEESPGFEIGKLGNYAIRYRRNENYIFLKKV